MLAKNYTLILQLSRELLKERCSYCHFEFIERIF